MALYTFRYEPLVDAVIVTIRKGSEEVYGLCNIFNHFENIFHNLNTLARLPLSVGGLHQ